MYDRDLENRVSEIETDLDYVSRVVQNLDESRSTDTSDMDQKIQDVSTDFDGLDSRFEVLVERVRLLEARLNQALADNTTHTTPVPDESCAAPPVAAGARRTDAPDAQEPAVVSV